jgi:hypothetical protein
MITKHQFKTLFFPQSGFILKILFTLGAVGLFCSQLGATGTCHTNHFEMEMVIEMEMCSWHGKFATQVEVLLNLLWLGTLSTRPWQLQACIHNINLLQQL